MKIKTPPFDYKSFQAQLAIFLPCQHSGAEPRRRMKSNGQPYFKIQCPHCGKPLSNHLAFDLVEDFRRTWGSIKPWDYGKEKEWLDRRLTIGEILRQNENLRRRASWWFQYEEYLLSPIWSAVRRRIIERAGGSCERCRERPPKHIHHLCYQRLGEENDDDLMAVCVECHQALHPDRKLNAAF